MMFSMTNSKETKQERSERKSRQRAVKRTFLLIIGLVAVAAVVFGLVYSSKQRTGTPQGVNNDVVSVQADDHVLGQVGGVTLIEYSDFQCPACAAFEPIVNEAVAEYGDDGLQFVYRHYPLPQHQNARLAAAASEAAGAQGKFWDMHQLLFANQTDWSRQNPTLALETFLGYATNLGLDQERFQTDLESEATAERVERDYLSGTRAGISGTPTFFLNGQEVQAHTAGEFLDLIAAAVNTQPNESDTATTTDQ